MKKRSLFKRISVFFISAVLTYSCVSNTCLSINAEEKAEENVQREYNGIYYEIIKDTYINITGCSDDVTDLIIPMSIDGMPVLTISDYAFSGKTNIKNVDIPDTICTIENNIFKGTDFSTFADGWLLGFNENYCKTGECSLEIKEGVTGIADNSFFGYYDYIKVTLPQSLKYIGSHVFMNSEKLKSITIPENVLFIGYNAFFYCIGLKEIYVLSPYCKFVSSTKWSTFYISSEKYGYDDSSFSKYAREQSCWIDSLGMIPEHLSRDKYFPYNRTSGAILLSDSSSENSDEGSKNVFDAIKEKRELIYHCMALDITGVVDHHEPG